MYPVCVQASFGDWHGTNREQLSVTRPQTPTASENEYDKHPHSLFDEQALYWTALLHVWLFTFTTIN
jgi:hypothetical protein